MKTSIQIHNRINELRREQAAIPADADNRAELLSTLQGQLNELDVQLADALEAEDQARNAIQPTLTLVGGRQSVGNRALGSSEAFDGIDVGFRNTVTLPTPEETDYVVPAFGDVPRGFVDTILGGTAKGTLNYFRRGAKTNAAAAWGGVGTDKAASSYAWTQVAAIEETIAHHVPVAKPALQDYGDLDGIINNELVVGLDQAKANAALNGTNSSGIVGILNTVGILTYTKAGDDNVYDSIRKMVTKVYLTSGFRPTHVAVAPQVMETMDLLKTTDGQYLRINSGGRVWSLEVVEDINLVKITETGTTPSHVVTTHYGVVVYYSGGASFKTVHGGAVTVGVIANQFIQNAVTMLAEGTYVLKVPYPDAFCYMVDGIASTSVTD